MLTTNQGTIILSKTIIKQVGMNQTPDKIIIARIADALGITEKVAKERAAKGDTVRIKQAAQILGVSNLTAWNKYRAGKFPNARKDLATSPIEIPLVDLIDYWVQTTVKPEKSEKKSRSQPKS